MRHFRTFLLLALVAASGAALAAGPAAKASAPAAKSGNAVILDAIHKLAPKADVQQVKPAPLTGFHSAVVGGTVVYVRDDGKYLIHGQIFDLSQPQVTDISETVMDGMRQKALAKLPASERIRFAPKDPKYHITAFVDVECPFCRQFHAKIDKYMSEGIAVDYLLFPLQGIHPQADRKAQAVWCAADRTAAYSAAMAGSDPGDATCENPLDKLKSLGQRLGVTGTPTIVADDGSIISPRIAQSPKQLAAVLKAHKDAAGG
ncbi:MAG TPA: DsbC family protein [Rhodanobacteraceae bacterium]|nr:DsbC family protein [Rhodanobacteraceae bacterium]